MRSSTYIPLLALCACLRPVALPPQGDAPVELVGGWESSFDPDTDPQRPTGSSGWTPWRFGAGFPDRGGRNLLWLRVRLPQGRWRSPALFVRGVDTRFEVFLDGEPLPVGRPQSRPGQWGPMPPWSLIGLPDDAGGRLVSFRIESESSADIGPWGRIAVGSTADLLVSLLKEDGGSILVGLFCLSVAAVALALFLRRREELSYLALACWSAARGVLVLCFTASKQILWEAPGVWQRALPLARIAAPLSLWWMVDRLFGADPGWRRARRIATAALAVVAAVLIADPQRFYRWTWQAINVEWLVCQAAVLILVGRAALRRNHEARLFLAAWVFPLAGAIHTLAVAVHILPPQRTWDDVAELLLVAAVGVIVLGRLSSVYAALQGHARELELKNEQLRQTEARLTEALQARDEFLSVASHELRTPLTSLQLQVQLLRRGTVADPPRALDIVQRQTRRLEKLTGDLLDVARAQARRLSLDLEEVDLAAVAREVVARTHDDAARMGSDIVLDAPDALVGRWDRVRVDQVIANLVSNALKYGGGKPVHLRIHREEGAAVAVVRDQGIGIAPVDQARIFERFERAASSRNYGGLGLGLWIAREIVVSLGGRISVQSLPGEGATFRVELPISATGAPGSRGPDLPARG